MLKKLINSGTDLFSLSENQREVKKKIDFLLTVDDPFWDLSEDLDLVPNWKTLAENTESSMFLNSDDDRLDGKPERTIDIAIEISAIILKEKIQKLTKEDKRILLKDSNIFASKVEENNFVISHKSLKRLHKMIINFLRSTGTFNLIYSNPVITNHFINQVRFTIIKDFTPIDYKEEFITCYLYFVRTLMRLKFKATSDKMFYSVLDNNPKWIDVALLAYEDYYESFNQIEDLANFASFDCSVYLHLLIIDNFSIEKKTSILDLYFDAKYNYLEPDTNDLNQSFVIGMLEFEKVLIQGYREKWIKDSMLIRYISDLLNALGPDRSEEIKTFIYNNLHKYVDIS